MFTNHQMQQPRQTVQELLAVIPYQFNDFAIGWEALQAAGSNSVLMRRGLNGRMMPRDGHKSLAIVGDAVLKAVLTCEMYEAGWDRGRMSEVVQRYLSNANFARIGRAAGIVRLIQRSMAQATVPDSTVATAVEAIIGAVYLDSDRQEQDVLRVMQTLGLVPDELLPVTFI